MSHILKELLLFFSIFLLLSCEKHQDIYFKDFAVVSAKIEASEAGYEILKMGGNAFDAMIATDLALAVVYPNAGNLGGGGFMVYRTADGDYGSLDYREKAPLASTKDMYLDEDNNVVKGLSSEGALSIGVPGTVAGLFETYRRFGSLPLDSLFKPAMKLAKHGFPLTKKQAKSFNLNKRKILSNSNNIDLFKKDFIEGMVFNNPALYSTLKFILENGKDGFYGGRISDEIIEFTASKGGVLSKKDFLSYKPIWRSPFIFNFNNLKIITMGLPSSGGIVLAQILKSLEEITLENFKERDINYIKTLIELEKLSFADRSKYLGDPDFYNTDFLDSLTDSQYLKKRIKSINFTNPIPSKDIYPGNIKLEESNETTHYSILDKFGNSVAVTTTLNSNFGSKIIIPKLGFFMNNEMDDFSIKPGSANNYGLIGGKINSIQPEKRMLSSMTPTIIEKNGKLSMILGSPGGPTIITSVLETILNVYLFNDKLSQAINRPRFYHLWLPDKVYYEKNAIDNSVMDSLKNIGYSFNTNFSSIGRVDAIYLDESGRIFAVPDPRGDDYAIGE